MGRGYYKHAPLTDGDMYMLKTTYYIVSYRLRGESTLHELRENDIKQAYSFLGSIRRLCSHTDIRKVIEIASKPTYELVTA